MQAMEISKTDLLTPHPFEEIRFTTRDGLRLYGRRYRASLEAGRRPVLCLAGLTRNSRDFRVMAEALASHPHNPRDVYTLDARGRGMSEYDTDWRNYAVPVEMLDAIDFMTRCELSDVAVVGTSRGGLVAMVMAAAQPSTIGAVVLNGAKIGKGCLIGANALVTEGMEVPDGSMVLGSPAKIRKQLTAEQQLGLMHNADHYIGNAARFCSDLQEQA